MKKIKKLSYYEAVGRRKQSTAHVRLYLTVASKQILLKDDKENKEVKIKTGDIFLNFKPIEKIYQKEYEKNKLFLPLKLTKSIGRFAISIIVKGGGKLSQLEAIVHGIARALEKVDKESYRPILKKAGLLTRDPRKKERRKVGTGGKARRKKQSPKR